MIEWEASYRASKYYIQIYDLNTNELLSEEIVSSNHYHYTLPFKHIYIHIQSSNEWLYSNGVYYFFDHETPSRKKHQKALIINNTSFPNGDKSAYDFKMLLNHYHIETKYYWNLSVEELEIILKFFSMNSNEDDITYILLNGHGSKNGIGICKDGREDKYVLYTYLKNSFDP